MATPLKAVSVPLLLMAGSAWAHDADVIYAQLTQASQSGALNEVVTLTSNSLQLLAPVDADGDLLLTQADLDARSKAIRIGVWDEMPLTAGGVPCEFLGATARLREGFIELAAQHRCGAGELRQDFKILRVLPANYRIVLGTQLDGEQAGRLSAQGSFTALTIPRPAPPGSFDGARFRLAFDDGVRRGLSILFLSALLALGVLAKSWARGFASLGLYVAGLFAGSWFDGGTPSLPAAAVLAIALVAMKDPLLVLAPILGVALGCFGGGGGLSASLGMGAGTVAVTAIAGPVAMALSRIVQRRARVWTFARWLGPLGVVVGALSSLRVW
ncbi:MAG: hypothetical protein QM817_14855 [Archangium sp.]